MTADSSTIGIGGVLSLTFSFSSTTTGYVSLVGYIRRSGLGEGVIIVIGDVNSINLRLVAILSVDVGSGGMNESWILNCSDK